MSSYINVFYILGFLGIALVLSNVLAVVRTKVSARYLLFFVLSILAWQITLYLYYVTKENLNLTLIGRVNFSASAFMVSSLLLFTIAFPKDIPKKYYLASILIIVETVLLAIITLFTPLIAENEIWTGYEHKTEFGYLYPLFVIHFIGYASAIIVIFLKKYISEQEPFKTQIRYIMIGTILSCSLGIITNIILPWIFNYFELQKIAPVWVVLLSIFLTYTVAKHRLFDTKIVLGRVFHTAILSVFLTLSFYTIIYIQTRIWGTLYSPDSLISGIVLSVFYIPIFHYLNNAISNFLDIRFVYSTYNPKDIINELTLKTANILDIPAIYEVTNKTIAQPMNISNLHIIVCERDKIIFSSAENSYTSAIIALSHEIPEGVNLDDIFTEFQKVGNRDFVIETLQRLKIQILIPLVISQDNKALLCIGKKLDNKPYTSKEIEIFEMVKGSLSLCIGRALLHYSIKSFNLTLQQKVDSATKELTESNKELEDLYKNLKEIYQKEKDLMDVAGHEFRTPASILKLNLYLLKKRLTEIQNGKPDEKIQKYLDRLLEGTERQIKLIETFLESARINNERFEIQVEKTDITKMAATTVSELRPFAQQKKLDLNYNPPEKPIFAEVDKVRIREVLDNLLNNAIKYTKKGGIVLKLSETDDTFSFSIKDSGIGIKPEDRDLLFKKFSRVDNYIGGEDGSIVRPGGTGLGLFVAKTIVDAHKGTIAVESTPGVGSIFTVQIPKQQPSYVKRVRDIQKNVFKEEPSEELARIAIEKKNQKQETVTGTSGHPVIQEKSGAEQKVKMSISVNAKSDPNIKNIGSKSISKEDSQGSRIVDNMNR